MCIEPVSPLDQTPYPPHPDAKRLGPDIADGFYVYVLDESGTVWVLADGPHRHPRVLGLARSVLYAGDCTIKDGVILDLTNLSGTFKCNSIEGLRIVANACDSAGLFIGSSALRFFPADGGCPIVVDY